MHPPPLPSVENNGGGTLENNSSVENNRGGTLENQQLILNAILATLIVSVNQQQ